MGPWLPEPLLTAADPADTVEQAESLTLGFLVVLERLAPVERAVFLLGDVFGEPYAAIAAVVDRSEDACRQIAARARRRVRDARRRVTSPAGAATATDLVHRFMAACAFGQVDELRSILVEDVVLVSDGGRTVHAARRPVVGAAGRRFLANVTRRLPVAVAEMVRVNGEPGLFRRGAGVRWRSTVTAAVRLVINRPLADRRATT